MDRPFSPMMVDIEVSFPVLAFVGLVKWIF